jgi:hypothetical protein
MKDDNAQLPARLEDIANVMLEETSGSNALLLYDFNEGRFRRGDDEIELGREYIAYPFDALRGFVRWQDGKVVDKRLGLIRDKFKIEREELPEDEDWQPQHVLPLEDAQTGEFLAFASGSVGGKIACEKLINATARLVKAGRGNATPRVKIGIGKFKSGYGEKDRPDFEIVPELKEVNGGTAEPPFNDDISY